VKPSRINKAHWRTAVAVVLSLVAVHGTSPANAADSRPTRAQASRVDRSAMPMSPRGVIERRQIVVERRAAPQVAAAGSTVVLRGSRSPAFPNLNAPGPNLNGAGYGSSQAAGPVLQPAAGWDRELDYGGLDYGGSTPLVVTSP
jgi:hypothetical protein